MILDCELLSALLIKLVSYLLTDGAQYDSARRSLRSADVQTCVVPRTAAAMATELLQPLDLVCGTLYRSSCSIQTSPTDCLGGS